MSVEYKKPIDGSDEYLPSCCRLDPEGLNHTHKIKEFVKRYELTDE